MSSPSGTADAIAHASALRRGVEVWYAVFGGIGAWTVHLLALVALVRFTCNAHDYLWVMHVLTVVTAAATVLAIGLSWRLVRAGRPADESGSDPAGRLHFLGQVGLLVGAVNLALILLEGLYVLLIPACG